MCCLAGDVWFMLRNLRVLETSDCGISRHQRDSKKRVLSTEKQGCALVLREAETTQPKEEIDLRAE